MTNTISLTQPIRIPFDARSERYRKGILLAYPGLFLLMAGDAVRYSIGWLGWGIAIALGIFATVVFLVAFDARSALRRTPEPLALLLLLMGLSLIWSQYRPQTLLSFTVQIGATLFGYFLVNQFGWRQLLNILGNTIRFILSA